MKHRPLRRSIILASWLSLSTLLVALLTQSCSNNNSPSAPTNPVPTYTFTFTFTFSPTSTTSNTPTNSPTKTPTGTPTNSPTITPTSTPTNSATNSPTPTISNTATFSPTPTVSNTATDSPTDTPSNTPTDTPTITNTPTITSTFTFQPTPVVTNSWSTGTTYITGLLVSGSDLYLADYSDGLLLKENLAGTPVPGWPNPVVGNAWGLAQDGSGNILVTQYSTNQVTVFNPTATPIATWTTGASANGITKDGAGNFYIGNYYSGSIQKYDPSGNLLTSVSSGQNPIAVAAIGTTVFAGDENNNIIRTYDLSLSPLPLTWTVTNNGAVMTTDSLGRLYIANDGGQAIGRYSPSGVVLTQWGNFVSYGLACDAANNIYVSDYSAHTITVFSP